MTNVYEKMKQTLEQKGWNKGRLEDEDGQCCLLGARSYALNGGVYDLEEGYMNQYDPYHGDKYTDQIAKIIQDQYPDFVEWYLSCGGNFKSNTATVCYDFNDWDKTAYEDIVLVLEKAAASEQLD